MVSSSSDRISHHLNTSEWVMGICLDTGESWTGNSQQTAGGFSLCSMKEETFVFGSRFFVVPCFLCVFFEIIISVGCVIRLPPPKSSTSDSITDNYRKIHGELGILGKINPSA